MKQVADFYTWTKGEHVAIGDYFSTREFSCRCAHGTCITQKIHTSLVAKLDAVRGYLKAPLSITSGFRCNEKQRDLAAQGCETARGVSTHELGMAADIIAADADKLLEGAELFFHSIGIGRGWLHVDLRKDKERRWYYK